MMAMCAVYLLCVRIRECVSVCARVSGQIMQMCVAYEQGILRIRRVCRRAIKHPHGRARHCLCLSVWECALTVSLSLIKSALRNRIYFDYSSLPLELWYERIFNTFETKSLLLKTLQTMMFLTLLAKEFVEVSLAILDGNVASVERIKKEEYLRSCLKI